MWWWLHTSLSMPNEGSETRSQMINFKIFGFFSMNENILYSIPVQKKLTHLNHISCFISNNCTFVGRFPFSFIFALTNEWKAINFNLLIVSGPTICSVWHLFDQNVENVECCGVEVRRSSMTLEKLIYIDVDSMNCNANYLRTFSVR